MKTIEEPKGIPFYSIKTGETHYCKLEPTIAAYINSSDMGINASRDQDYGWRLGAEWVQKVRDFKRNRTQVSILTAKNQGQKPTTVQILYYLYGEELAEYYESQEENDSPYEEQYQKDIAGKPSRAPKKPVAATPKALEDFNADVEDEDDISDLIDDAVMDSEEVAAPAPKAEKAPKQK